MRGFVSFAVVQTQPATIDDTFNLDQLNEIAAMGFEGVALAYYAYQSNRYGTAVDGLTFAGTTAAALPTSTQLTTWTAHAKSLGLKVMLKMHLQMNAGGAGPPWSGGTPAIIPGGLNRMGCQTSSTTNDWGSRFVNGRQSANATPITAASAVGTAVTTTQAGDWLVGEQITIASAAGGTWSNINGTWTITAVGSGTVTFTVTTGPTGTYTANSANASGPIVNVGIDTSGNITLTNAGSSWVGFTSADVGRRVLCGQDGSGNPLIPNCTLSNYGTTAPGTWNTIASVTDGRHAALATPPTGALTNTTLGIINDDSVKGAPLWFSNWQTVITTALATMQAAGGVDWVNISTEQEWLTMAFESEFRGLITSIRQTVPNISVVIGPNQSNVMASGSPSLISTGFNVCKFWDALGIPGGAGILCLDAYMSVQGAAGDPLSTVLSNWSTYNGQLQTIKAAWQAAFPAATFPWFFTEIGYPSCPGAGIQGRTITGTDGGADQNTCITGMIESPLSQQWMQGFVLWNWANPTEDPTDPPAAPSFSVNGQPASTTLKANLKALSAGTYMATSL
ncbi:MAG: hypothetical protein KGL39_04285 [Patescibacteria group bacterium]|nr:hypothetical protein [Patescibacteria group bacterium]